MTVFTTSTADPHDFFVLYAKLKSWPIYLKMLIFDELLDLIKIVGKVAFVVKRILAS